MWRTEDFVEITANIVINFIIIIFLVSKASPIPRTRKKMVRKCKRYYYYYTTIKTRRMSAKTANCKIAIEEKHELTKVSM